MPTCILDILWPYNGSPYFGTLGPSMYYLAEMNPFLKDKATMEPAHDSTWQTEF